LLTRFGGLKGVIGASVEDLTQVEGISRKARGKIYQELMPLNVRIFSRGSAS